MQVAQTSVLSDHVAPIMLKEGEWGCPCPYRISTLIRIRNLSCLHLISCSHRCLGSESSLDVQRPSQAHEQGKIHIPDSL